MHSRAIFFRTTLALLVALLAGCASTEIEPAPASSPRDPALEPVTYENLYERENYWPPNVMLTEPWKPEGGEGEGIAYGAGALIRVEPSGELWMRFPRRIGTHHVPARVTNVISEANRIREGEFRKSLPNFVMMAGNKLVIPKTKGYANPYGFGPIERYLLVAVDPMSESFAEIASALESVRGDALPVLFPQGTHSNDQVLARCEEVGWADPFLYSQFVIGFTAAYFGDDLEPPRLILQTANGRLIYESGWGEGALTGLSEAVQRDRRPVDASG